jgi:pSer/pThr/pTyr-binding forkhead associated (FHA) protein
VSSPTCSATCPPRRANTRPPPRPRARRLGAAVAATCSMLTTQFRALARTPRAPRLVLPRGRAVFTIGRAHDCDLPLSDMTVSRYHAELRRSGDEWLLVDVGSTNGTRANGWRVGQGFTVRAGDRVSFGLVTFVLADRA